MPPPPSSSLASKHATMSATGLPSVTSLGSIDSASSNCRCVLQSSVHAAYSSGHAAWICSADGGPPPSSVSPVPPPVPVCIRRPVVVPPSVAAALVEKYSFTAQTSSNSHAWPCHPIAQTQLIVDSPLLHVPPFWQGFPPATFPSSQKSIAKSQWPPVPLIPDGHTAQ